jgi:acyl-homoserine-lactone acylase
MKFRILLFVIGFILALSVGLSSFATNPQMTEILWDTYGVPHIYGKDVKSAFYAFGWSQMQSHGNLILRLYGTARGRAAEYWGEEYLESDRWVRSMGIFDRAQTWYEQQSPTFRRYLDAFAAGINYYAQKHPELIDDSVEAVLPVNAIDVLAHAQRVLNFTFVVDPKTVAELSKQERNYGSNAWAIAPEHSESGNAILLANPHLPWSDLFLWYEAQIVAPGIDAYGATLVGIPVLAIAFNDNLGWAHTVNTYDGWDVYELTLVDGGYRFDGKVRAFETQEQILKIKQKDGSLRQEKLLVRRSIHGPIVAEKESKAIAQGAAPKAIALRVAGLDRGKALEQWWDMARATNFARFEAVLKRLQLPMFTVMYADREGHILHLFNGHVPVRARGDFNYWQGIIPGDTSATLWTKIHPYKDLPCVLDPKSGWLQNANEPPWTTTFPIAIDPDDYPAYIAPRGYMNFRAQRSARMLAEDEKISFEEAIEYKHSTRMELADRILDDLIDAARGSDNAIVRQAIEVLQAWDRQADADSQGAVLFDFWTQEMDFPNSFAIPWRENAPRLTPDGLKDPQKAVTALETASAKVEAAYGKLDIKWGEVFRLRYGTVDLPANGGFGDLGIFRVVNFEPEENGRFYSVDGDSYVAAIEFSNPVKAMALISYGNATQPHSSHVGAQLELFARKQLRVAWRSRQEIITHLAQRQVFAAD